MADELLNAVIRLENQIQHHLQQEQARADAWLAGVRAEQEALETQARQDLAAENERLLAEATEDTKQRSAALVSGETLYCKRLEKIGDQELLEVLRQQLHRILPERADDHQDVQG